MDPSAPKPPQNVCTDVKPRLTKEQHDILETHFLQQHKPSTATKKGFADKLNVPLDKVNNWFQNRRAKVKQDLKKQMNQYNMSMGIYGTQQMSMANTQYPPRAESQSHLPVPQDFYAANAEISPASLPVQSVECPSTLDLSAQMGLQQPPQQPYDMHHSLRSIPEADRTQMYHPGAVMHSLMAASAGASYMHTDAGSLPGQSSGYGFDSSGLPSVPHMSFPMDAGLPNVSSSADESFAGFPDFGTLDYASLSAEAAHANQAQMRAESHSSERSPQSGARSTDTTQSSAGVNSSSVASITSMYSGWTDDHKSQQNMKVADDPEDFFDQSFRIPQASASDAALPYWSSNDPTSSFAHAGMYQHTNSSAHAVCTPSEQHARNSSLGPGDLEPPSAFGDEGFMRRNSSTSNLANNIEAIRIQSTTPSEASQGEQNASIAVRRQKRPVALSSTSMRSSSYSSSLPSPGSNPDRTIRKIRSVGIGSAAGRVQKSNPGSAQRSPMAQTFADAAQSPKFARTFSASSSTTTLGQQGGSLAPPTPSTPNEIGPFPYWQSNTVFRSHPAMPDHSSPESLNATWSTEPPSAGIYSHGASPSASSLELAHLTQAQLANEAMYRDTPPQSAPATQQTFPRKSFMQPPQMRAGFHSSTDLTLPQSKPAHTRRPSLPEGAQGQAEDGGLAFNAPFGNFHNYDDTISLSGITHNVPFAPPVSAMPDFLVHQYAPSSGSLPHQMHMRRTTEPQPKSYIFANHGPHDFRT